MRVRRDANDQLVLAHVYNRLSSIVSHLTIQIFKDDWNRSTAYQIINNPAMVPPVTPIKPVAHYSLPPTIRPSYTTGSGSTGQPQPWTSTPYGTPQKHPQ